MPSLKHAMAIEYSRFMQDSLTSFSVECALPLTSESRDTNYIKFEAKQQKRWPLVADKVNFICDIEAGKILPLNSNQSTFVNDRFFLYNRTGGYQSIGHTEPSIKKVDDSDKKAQIELKKNIAQGKHKVIMGDDMGCDQYIYMQNRLDFLNIPYLS